MQKSDRDKSNVEYFWLCVSISNHAKTITHKNKDTKMNPNSRTRWEDTHVHSININTVMPPIE